MNMNTPDTMPVGPLTTIPVRDHFVVTPSGEVTQVLRLMRPRPVVVVIWMI
jgi:hypothetical protein